MAFGHQTNFPSGGSAAPSVRRVRRKKATDGTRRIVRMLDRLLLLDAFIIAGYLIAILWDDPDLIDAANMLGPSLTGLGAAYTAYRMVKREVLVVWTPYFWFLGAIALYYALGPLVYIFGSEALLRYVTRSLPILVTPIDLFRTNLLNSVGIASILLGVRIGWMVYPRAKSGMVRSGSELQGLSLLAIWLLVIGGAIQFLVILPWEFGVFDFVLPGVVKKLGKLFIVGIMILAYVETKGKTHWNILMYILWSIQLLIALIHFSKTEVMISILLPVLGIYMADRNTKRLLLSFMVMALIYTAISQMVHYGRYEVIRISGELNKVGVGERLEITKRWFEIDEADNPLTRLGISSAERAWARLSYVNVQSFAMSQYDRNMPGNSLAVATYVLIPRLLWPNKPITTDISIDFYELVTGWRGFSHLGLGIFGEGYWNLGWFGVVSLGLVTGIVFWMVGLFSVNWMRWLRMEYMPSVFMGITMGLLGTTQFFANAIVGNFGIFVVYSLVVSKVLSVLLGKHK